MSQPDQEQPLTIAAVPHAQKMLDQWAASLIQVLESMTEQKPEIQWQSIPDLAARQEDLWWEQPFSVNPEVAVWVGAPRATWEKAGAMTLKAAGLDNVETAEAKSTWIEILSQSLSAMARTIGSIVGREVTCDAGAERPPVGPLEAATISIALGVDPLEPLTIAISPKLLALLAGRAAPSNSPTVQPGHGPETPAGTAAQIAPPPTMELLMDVELPVSVSFGKTQLPMKDVLKLTTGSIVELNRGVNETVEVLVNHCLIARGEVVVVEGNYGVRIQQITSKQERLRTIR